MSWPIRRSAKLISAKERAMLRLEHLSCGYGELRAVEDLSVEVPAGALLALLGPNGAGKTSTIMAIMGHTTISSGQILFEGRNITRAPAVKRAAFGIALVPEGRRLFADLTVEENLTVGGYSRAFAHDAANRERVYSLFPLLRDRRKQIAGSMSGGEQQMLAIGRALMAEPKLLLIDELSLGLMPKMVDLCFDALAALRRDGLTVVLVEQNTTRALEIADTVCVLASGSVVFSGPAAAAKTDVALFETFLGRAH
jgi:branched-chain amino acid transport system ATP-binding protein